MYIKFWGTRGSIPVPGEDTFKYGGNTPCIEIRTDTNELIILDAGSGIRELGKTLNSRDNHIPVLISHYHWDHIQGIPFFKPLFQKNNRITFYGLTIDGSDVKEVLSNQMIPSHFPIDLSEFDANVRFKSVEPNNTYKVKDVTIETYRSNHTTDTLTYKIISGNKSLVYMPDNEIIFESSSNNVESFDKIEELNKGLIDFCKGCDYLIHDSMYDDATLKKKKGWGHSSNILLAYFSIIADVKHLVLFHYNPDYIDSKIDEIVEETNSVLKGKESEINCIGAQEGMEIDF